MSVYGGLPGPGGLAPGPVVRRLLRTALGQVDAWYIGRIGPVYLEAIGAASFAVWMVYVAGELSSVGGMLLVSLVRSYPWSQRERERQSVGKSWGAKVSAKNVGRKKSCAPLP